MAEYHHCGPRKPHWWSFVHANDRYTCDCGRSWIIVVIHRPGYPDSYDTYQWREVT